MADFNQELSVPSSVSVSRPAVPSILSLTESLWLYAEILPWLAWDNVASTSGPQTNIVLPTFNWTERPIIEPVLIYDVILAYLTFSPPKYPLTGQRWPWGYARS